MIDNFYNLLKIAKKNNKIKFGKVLKQKIHRTSTREQLYQKYGPKAFLMPQERKFPIVHPQTGKVSCKLLRAAKIRAAQHGYQDVVAKANRLLKQNHCI